MKTPRQPLALSLVATALIALTQPAASHAQAAQRARPEPIAAGFIIKFKDGSRTPVAAKSAVQGFRAMTEARGQRVAFDRESAFGRRVIRLARHVPARDLALLARDIQLSDPSIESVEIDRVMRTTMTPNDSSWSKQWDMDEGTGGIHAPKAWDLSTGFGVRVAVLDTGVRPHADLVANLLPGYDFITDSERAGDGGGRDGDASDPGDGVTESDCWFEPAKNSGWHGTHVAGTIAAVGSNAAGISGVAPKAKIVPVRVLGKCGGTTSDVADGIVWAAGGKVSNVPTNANPAQILNLSLGSESSCSGTFQDAINFARSKGALVVVAAGNDSQDVSEQEPANCKGVMAVAATNKLGAKSDYSNFGAGVDIAAPGGDTTNGAVLSLSNTGTMGPVMDTLSWKQGTSMAAPHVSGVAALMMASNSLLQGSDTAYLMKATARSFPGSCSGCGAGIVDAEQAVIAARGFRPEKEPNDTLATAQYLNVFPSRVIGTLQAAYPEKVDIFSMNLAAGYGLSTRLALMSIDFNFTAAMDLLDATGKVLATSKLISGKPEINYYNTSGKSMAVYVRVKGVPTGIGLPSGDKAYELRTTRNPYGL